MKYKMKVVGLDCAECTQKVEDAINKIDGIKEASLSFATGALYYESEEDLRSTVVATIHQTEDGLTITDESKGTSSHEKHEDSCHDHSCQCHAHEEHKEKHLEHPLRLAITGLDCASCGAKIEERISKMDEVKEASVLFSAQVLEVVPQEGMDQDTLIPRIQKVVDEVEEGVTISRKSETQFGKPKLFEPKDHIDLIIGVVVYLGCLFLPMGMIRTIGYLVAYLLIGHEILFMAIKNIFHGEMFDENFLMCVATIGAFAIGQYSEAVAVLLFYSIGEIFQAYAVNKTRNSVSSLMDIKSTYANLLVNGQILQVAPEEVNVGDVIVVKVGEKVPLDGEVISGKSMLDTSSLTGESVPREILPGGEVLGGVVNLSEIIQVKVTKPYADSTVSRIIELMEKASSKKAPIEKFITRFAKIYTPSVCLAAVFLSLIPILFIPGTQPKVWLYRSLTFLVVSCPCALVISIPLGLYAGLGKASKMGALIKGGNYLEILKDLDTVVFDKTGTLTEGSFDVVSIENEEGYDDLLEYAAYGECMSNHPIAKSIVSKYNRGVDQTLISDFKETAGKGISVTYKNHALLLGTETYLHENQITTQKASKVGTIVHIAIDGHYAGLIVVADRIKDSTAQGIKKLKAEGIKHTVMLTGDRQEVAEDVAHTLGIDTVYAQLLPQDKVTQLETILANAHGSVGFVGDGINDAPVLARADVGIAMGGVGSDAAVEAADIVLMQDHIETIGDAIDVSKRTNKILKENVTFTLIIKLGVLVLTVFGLSNMWMGVFADVGVTLLAILNALRILK